MTYKGQEGLLVRKIWIAASEELQNEGLGKESLGL